MHLLIFCPKLNNVISPSAINHADILAAADVIEADCNDWVLYAGKTYWEPNTTNN
jgi:hypothetical protein